MHGILPSLMVFYLSAQVGMILLWLNLIHSIKHEHYLLFGQECPTANIVVIIKEYYISIHKSEHSLLVISKFGIIVFSNSMLK